jgi:hypothetical protein
LPGNFASDKTLDYNINGLYDEQRISRFLSRAKPKTWRTPLLPGAFMKTLDPNHKNLDRLVQLCDIFISSGDSWEEFRLSPGQPDEPEPAALTNTFEAIKCIWRNAVGYGRCFFYDILELWQ